MTGQDNIFEEISRHELVKHFGLNKKVTHQLRASTKLSGLVNLTAPDHAGREKKLRNSGAQYILITSGLATGQVEK